MSHLLPQTIHHTILQKISDVIQEYDLDILHMHYAVPHAVCGSKRNKCQVKRQNYDNTTWH